VSTGNVISSTPVSRFVEPELTTGLTHHVPPAADVGEGGDSAVAQRVERDRILHGRAVEHLLDVDRVPARLATPERYVAAVGRDEWWPEHQLVCRQRADEIAAGEPPDLDRRHRAAVLVEGGRAADEKVLCDRSRRAEHGRVEEPVLEVVQECTRY
jgi:hypothetical protein